jgi:excinuclease UvrABC ATPase subunit
VKFIEVENARTHNLKNVSCKIPRHKLVVFTGLSGAGKSSLLYHTIYTEAQRQLVETFSTFAQRRLPQLSRPPADEIRNLSTPIIIDQKPLGKTLRSTVGTATEVSTYLRLLFSRAGEPSVGPSFYFSFNNPEGMCPDCKGVGRQIHIDAGMLIDPQLSIADGGVTHPEYKVGSYYWREIMRSGLFDNRKALGEFTQSKMDTLLYSQKLELERELEGQPYIARFEGVHTKLERIFVSKAEDEVPEKRKNAYQKYLTFGDCPACKGTRINERARSVRIAGKNIAQLSSMELTSLDEYLESIDGEANRPLIRKMRGILSHLIYIGVGYLSLDRPVATLSGGESQRVKMARQLDCDLVDMMYILDEPSIGLHPRDNEKLIRLMKHLRDKGNSVLAVEHDPDIIRASDWIVDIGPRAGSQGGELMFSGVLEDLLVADTPTSHYLSGSHPLPRTRRKPSGWFEIRGASLNNLKSLDVDIPRGVLSCVTGVAGSGKSSLIHGIFLKSHRDAVLVDQSPVGRSSRSTPVSYIGIFDEVRKYFAKETGTGPGLFSFNSSGACPKCKGQGAVKIEMNFMDDISIVCDECGGRQYTPEVLDLKVRGVSIYDILQMTASDALGYFTQKKITRPLEMLERVGLGYLELGQPLSSLSGGEAQRIKLASELHKSGSVYVMDEPTTGLHGEDIAVLLKVIHDLTDNGNSVIIIEHNLDIIAQADWVIDLGPEGGAGRRGADVRRHPGRTGHIGKGAYRGAPGLFDALIPAGPSSSPRQEISGLHWEAYAFERMNISTPDTVAQSAYEGH